MKLSHYFYFLLFPLCRAIIVTVYEKANYQGESLTLNVNGCIPKLPIIWSVYSAQVQGVGNCVRFHGVDNCKSDFFEIKDNSPSAENTHRYLYWHEKVKSLSPCEDHCDTEHVIKYRESPKVSVDLYKSRYLSGFKVSTVVEYGKCTPIPSEMAGKVSSLRKNEDSSCIELHENSDCTGPSVVQRGPANIQNMLNMEVFDKRAKSISFCGYSCLSSKKENSTHIFNSIRDNDKLTKPVENYKQDPTKETPTFAKLEVLINSANGSVHYDVKLPATRQTVNQTISELHKMFQEFLKSRMEKNSSGEFAGN